MDNPPEEGWSLTNVPLDILVLVAKALLPYDLLSLSSTCSLLRALLYDKGLWLSIATSLSYHRPLPFTASQAIALPVEHIFRTCLRTERVAKRWSWNSDLRPRPQNAHIKISFPDKRNIPYFTILPGARRIMAFDVKNTLSCWSTDGKLLGTYVVERGARLTRWKPIDESDSQFDVTEGAMQYTVEVMVEHVLMQTRTTRYEVILLKYDDNGASFKLHEKFCLPNVYEPDSAMSQDELWGALVHFSGDDTERFGIYLVDRNAKKAVCIDPGVVPEYAPQALISSKYLVLYWETSFGPRSYAYKMPTLRSILATHGLHCDGDDLHDNISIPVHISPDEQYFASFNTVRRPNRKSTTTNGANEPNPNAEEEEVADETIIRNNDWYPIVIPKWTTMTDDLTAHWTRSVMTLSRRPPPLGPHPPMGPGMILNQLNAMFPPFPGPNAPVAPAAGNAQPNAAQAADAIDQLAQMAAAQAAAFHALENQINNQLNNLVNGVNAGNGQQPPQPPIPQPPQAVPLAGQEDEDTDEDIDMEDEEEEEGEGGMPPLLPAANEFPPPDPNAPPEPPPPPMPNGLPHFHVHHGRPPARLMTITHHYYSFTDKEPQIKRTLIAEARIRQPRHPGHFGIVGFDVFMDGPGVANVPVMPFGNGGVNGGAGAPGAAAGGAGANGGANGAPNVHIHFGVGGANIGGGANGVANGNPGAAPPPPQAGMPLPGWFNIPQQPPAAGPEGQGQGQQMNAGVGFHQFILGLGGMGMAAPPAQQPGGAQPGGAQPAGGQPGVDPHPVAAALAAAAAAAAQAPLPPGANIPGVQGAAAQPLPAGVQLQNEVPGLIDLTAEEMGGGTPVMGYGGRCALWVQEGDGARSSSREGIVKIATFPSHALQEIPAERRALLMDSYASLEKAGGNLCTVHMPECVDVENALAFDLDDVRGVVGVSNTKGEIWLVDYS